MDSSGRSGTLLLRGGAIGDFIVTLPLLESLRRAFPEERLEIVAHSAPGALARAAGLADAVHSIESGTLAPFFSRDSELPAEWRERFGATARVISFLHDPEGILAANARRAGTATWIAGPPRPLDGQGPAARQLAQPVERALGLPAMTPFSFRLIPDCAAHDEAGEILQSAPWIAIHPGSGSARKNWPVARWIELARTMLAERRERRLLLVGGEADVDALAALRAALPPDRLLAIEHAPLVRVAALLAACEAFLGHDSGISHLAAATGIPCVLLFGPSDPGVWAPPEPRVRVLRGDHGEMANISVDAVLHAIDAALRD